MSKITFGKYSGWDTEKLATFTDGQRYLAWGAEKLQSPKLRKEFSDALKNSKAADFDIILEAESILKQDGSCDWLDAEALARETKAELIEAEQRDAAIEAAKQRFFNALAQAGIDTAGAQQVFNLIQSGFDIEALREAEKAGRVQFTSPAKRNAVWQAAIGLDGDLDNIGL